MTYNYKNEKQKIFTEEGQRDFLKVRDYAGKLLKQSGAFMMPYAFEGVGGDAWFLMACVDRLVELGEIREVTPANVSGQRRVFVSV